MTSLNLSSLQFWLAVVGVLVLVAIVAQGVWQSRRAAALLRRQSEPVVPPVDASAVAASGLANGPREPSFEGDESAVVATLPANAQPALDPTLPAVAVRPRMAPARVDALIDAIASLQVDAPITGELALSHLPTSRRAGGKPFLIEGLERETGEWEPLRAGHWYSEFQAGLQLANRLGALNEIEFSEFVQKLQAFADAIGATPDFPDMLEEVGRGRELDAFASEHDAQLAMCLRAQRTPWPLPFVLQHAARHGFVAGATPGRLVLPSPEEGAPPMLSLHFDPQAALAEDPKLTRIGEITLAFDVPQTPPGDEPFNAWCAAGNALALGLDAVVTDDRGQPLTPEAFPPIGEELLALYAKLAERDLAAGSAAARRLFS